MEISFIYKSLKVSFWFTLLLSLFSLYYFGQKFTLGLISGSFWSIANFLLFVGLSKAFTDIAHNKLKIALYAFIKFGALYITGYLIISSSKVSLPGISVGFGIIFTVIFLQAIGMVFASLETTAQPEKLKCL
ncbi:MAG: hypothetical protein A2Y00_10695 [Omnitrophica WOR_2 bacterium GWF2_43_52]|nr:MAG: hypothetical protein A2Y00_10695 [Omnitrophica WOR_2 bacterium GWF2_43_52]OGX58629.1 MAG: hypothetical protein A2460_02935 [Omnitrophica WOR_2 bacterium RIFOXYC2_FULL_43_9]HAH19784.1 hypothetical protein [Candidatus Omnitrophota bacterium]HBG63409.1 hypothetical protein [Candidatus Omnitrophota bacterium]HCD37711.1 hypothetical protein [Candidatus Omnitrophota bacterium]